MKQYLLLLANVGALLSGQAAAPAGQPAHRSGCYSRLSDPDCDAYRIRRQEWTYGLPSLDRLTAQGVQVRRVFFVDAYDRDLGALSFTRRAGEGPHVAFQSPGLRATGLAGPVPLGVWNRILERWREFDREPFTAPPATVCLDSWEFFVEATDPGGRARSARRRRALDMCPRPDYVFWLAEQAVALFAPCNLLDNQDDPVTRLSICAAFRGDRMAAARAFLSLDFLRRASPSEALAALQSILDEGVVLNWRGDIVRGAEPARLRWQRGLSETPQAEFEWSEVIGINERQIVIRGSFHYDLRNSNEAFVATYRAPVTIRATGDGAGDFRINELSVQSFRRVSRMATTFKSDRAPRLDLSGGWAGGIAWGKIDAL
jgi:hypothetical protein